MQNRRATKPRVVVIGGPNGTGKTTCAGVLLPHDLAITQFVNADTIAAGLAGFAPESVSLQAGRIMIARIRELADQRRDFAFETTLSSRSFAPFLRQIRTDGYQINLLYIWLRTPELAVQRVQEEFGEAGIPFRQKSLDAATGEE
jgi:predicted ABC-type ATPase